MITNRFYSGLSGQYDNVLILQESVCNWGLHVYCRVVSEVVDVACPAPCPSAGSVQGMLEGEGGDPLALPKVRPSRSLSTISCAGKEGEIGESCYERPAIFSSPQRCGHHLCAKCRVK